jgi:hypothetical protein
MLRRVMLAVSVLAAALIASPARAQNAAAALVEALPGEINFVGATSHDGGRTTDVEIVLAPAQDVHFNTSDISVALWSPGRRLIVTRVRAIGSAEYALSVGETKRGVVRFAVPPGYDWHILSGSLRWQYQPLHPVVLVTRQPSPIALAMPADTPAPITMVRPKPPPRAVSHPDLVASRCQADNFGTIEMYQALPSDAREFIPGVTGRTENKTWWDLWHLVLPEARIPIEQCFFTNAYLGAIMTDAERAMKGAITDSKNDYFPVRLSARRRSDREASRHNRSACSNFHRLFRCGTNRCDGCATSFRASIRIRCSSSSYSVMPAAEQYRKS